MKRFFLFLTLVVLSFSSAQDIQDDLPVLGDRSSASVSLSGEFEMGRLWLSLFRSQAKEHSDPLVRSYIEDLIYRLAENSQVKDRRFEFIIIDDKSINAFAAAGGIIGINTGLFFYTNDESEFSSVMTHELAHLSQRHYARSQNRGSPLANALMILGSIALAAASNNPQAIITGPALMQQLNTNFTRSNEQEADRIGFNNLVKSGFDPKGQGRMFKILQDLSRNNSEDQFGYLRTHPFPKDRITDARIRETEFEEKNSIASYRDSVDFHLVKKRIESGIEQNPRGLIRKYSSELRKAKTKKDETISKYGLHLAYLNNKDYSKAFSLIRECIELDPININLQISLMEAHMKAGNILESVSLGKNLISLHPNNYSISLLLSQALFRDKKYDEAEEILNDISKKRPTDPFVWYELAEVQGFSNNLIGLHRSRAEYFFLTGRFEAAIMQLREASKLATNFFEVSESIRTRMEEIYQTTEALKRMG